MGACGEQERRWHEPCLMSPDLCDEGELDLFAFWGRPSRTRLLMDPQHRRV
jgi:hypothetical protein